MLTPNLHPPSQLYLPSMAPLPQGLLGNLLSYALLHRPQPLV